jgi:hypothetical protein
MNDILPHERTGVMSAREGSKPRVGERVRDWRKAMSDNVAYALLVYTGLQIFVTVHAMKDGTKSVLPYFALVVLIAGIIPACRWFERRWRDLSDEASRDEGLRGAFMRDVAMLWVLAIGLPFVLTGCFKAVTALM